MTKKSTSNPSDSQTEVLADHGQWRQLWEGDKITGYEGRFSKGDRSKEALLGALDDAEGVAWYLAVSNTTPKPRGGLKPEQQDEQKRWIDALTRNNHRRGKKEPSGLYHRPVDTEDAYVVRVDSNNARLDKFEAWAMKHTFLADSITAREAADERQRILKPWRNDHAIGYINNTLEWQSTESGGLQLTTSDAPTAYALAIYLHNEHYLDGRAFGKLFWQTNSAIRENKEVQFVIAIPPDKVTQFSTQFPNARDPKNLPGMNTEGSRKPAGMPVKKPPPKDSWLSVTQTPILPFDKGTSRS